MGSESVAEAGWGKWRSKSDPTIVYTARLLKSGTHYLVRGGGMGSTGNVRVPKEAWESIYEEMENV